MSNATLQPLTIEQNGVSLVYEPSKILRGPTKDNPTMRPNLKAIDLATLIKYVGEKPVFSFIEAKLNQLANTCFSEAFDEDTGNLDVEKLTKLLQGIEVQGETISSLEDRELEISTEVMELVQSGDLAAIAPRIAELRDERMKITNTLAEKREAAKVAAAKRAETKAKNEAAKGTTVAEVRAGIPA